MAINKIVYGGTTLLDLTDTTAEAADVATGKYFYTASGTRVEGTNSGGGSVSQDAQGYIVLPSTGGSDFTTAAVTINNPDTMSLFFPRLNSNAGIDYIDTLPSPNSGTFNVVLYKGNGIILPDGPYVISNVSGDIQDLSGAFLITGNASFTINWND